MQKKIKNKKRSICVFSGKRGGFGAYVPLMRQIEDDPDLALQILLGDMHSSKKFGNTYLEAKKLFPKSDIKLVNMNTGKNDSKLTRTKNLGTCLLKSANSLKHFSPDIVMVHGDRGEHLMVAFAALNLDIPVAHTQGGDISGNIDDIQRHAITKLAHIHFPETIESSNRIKAMGEQPWRIHTVGSIYIDRIVRKMYTPEAVIQKKYRLSRNEQYGIVIFHPDTYLNSKDNYKHMRNLLRALDKCKMRFFVVYPCSDPGYTGVINAIGEVKNNPKFHIFKNIENLDFLGLMDGASVLVGNSSCALVEAPYVHLPAVNIGDRQKGREREENVIDAKPTIADIQRKTEYVLTNSVFRRKLKKCGYRLGDGTTSQKIIRVLKKARIDKTLLEKKCVW